MPMKAIHKKVKSLRYGLWALPVMGLILGLWIQQGKAEVINNATLETPMGQLSGTLELPELCQQCPVVLLISGSGPTDRNGNQTLMKNNSLQHVALSLKAAGIASLRYDKRGIGASKAALTHESDLRFEDLIHDAQGWIQQLQDDARFGSVFVMGHSEGSLIGMVAAQQCQTQGFISLAGAGLPASEILERQLQAQSPALAQKAAVILQNIQNDRPLGSVPLQLKPLFRKSVLPYLRSWLAYDPRQEINKLNQASLIVQGEHDIQIAAEEAQNLHAAATQSELFMIKDMNHVLKQAPAERKANLKTYRQGDTPLHPELMPGILEFIKRHT